MAGAEEQVIVRFVSEVDEYAVSDEPLELPAKLTRYGLSELVNHLLQQSPPVPFDFLADGELLRTSLRKFMQLRALSGEGTLELRYFPLVREPSVRSQSEQPDWVSALCTRRVDGLIVTGSYDGVTRVFGAPADVRVTASRDGDGDGDGDSHRGGSGPGPLLCSFSPAASSALGAAASPVKALALLRAPDEGATPELIRSLAVGCLAVGCLDGSLRIWQLSGAGIAGGGGGGTGARAQARAGGEGDAACACECVGHEGSVEALAASWAGGADGDVRLASGGRDGIVCLWELSSALQAASLLHGAAVGAGAAAPADAAGGAGGGAAAERKGEAKRRKTGVQADAQQPPPPLPPRPVPTVSPLAVLRGHSQPVTGVAWAGAHSVVSASWDGSLRTWDASRAQCVHSVGGLKAIQALAVSVPAPAAPADGAAGGGGGGGGALGPLIAATGHDNGLVQLWDARAKPSEAAAARLLSHASWVTSVAFSETSEHLMLSASHDGTVKMWDVRGKLPLHTLSAHTDKVLCAGWGGADGSLILSGGADRKLFVHAT